jgi:hypothetical protein
MSTAAPKGGRFYWRYAARSSESWSGWTPLKTPLYGRLDWKGKLDPFDYLDAARLASFHSNRDKALAYGIYGGTPRYLASIDTTQSLAANIIRSVLAPNGNVRIQVETIVAQEHGLRELSEYNAMLSAIGAGATQRKEIALQTGLPQTFAFRTRLEKLVYLGLVEASRNFGATTSQPYRYHRLSDPALRFYYGVVAKYRSELELDDRRDIWQDHIQKDLDTYMGLVFERMTQQAYLRLRRLARLPIVREWGRWEGLDREFRQIEIDIVARRTDGGMLTGAVKWSAKRVGISLHTQHLEMLRRLSESGYAWAREALAPKAILLYVAAGGFDPTFTQQAEAAGCVSWPGAWRTCTPRIFPRKNHNLRTISFAALAPIWVRPVADRIPSPRLAQSAILSSTFRPRARNVRLATRSPRCSATSHADSEMENRTLTNHRDPLAIRWSWDGSTY